jgi:hypothetical protein
MAQKQRDSGSPGQESHLINLPSCTGLEFTEVRGRNSCLATIWRSTIGYVSSVNLNITPTLDETGTTLLRIFNSSVLTDTGICFFGKSKLLWLFEPFGCLCSF